HPQVPMRCMNRITFRPNSMARSRLVKRSTKQLQRGWASLYTLAIAFGIPWADLQVDDHLLLRGMGIGAI
ncbi:hypothetical protein BJX63DRAFT_416112, partial [Aspergillus granulosus]